MSNNALERETTGLRVVIDVELMAYGTPTLARLEREAAEIIEAINQDTRLRGRGAHIERDFVWRCPYCRWEYNKPDDELDCCDSMLTLVEAQS